MYEVDTAARRDDPARLTSGVYAKRVADISMASAKALDDLWHRAIKNSTRAGGFSDNSARKAAQRIVKEITARRTRDHLTVQSSKAALVTSRKSYCFAN